MIEDLFLKITRNFIEKQSSNNLKPKDKKEKNLKNNKTINIAKLNEPPMVKKKKRCC
jgi:hypothetical protein